MCFRLLPKEKINFLGNEIPCGVYFYLQDLKHEVSRFRFSKSRSLPLVATCQYLSAVEFTLSHYILTFGQNLTVLYLNCISFEITWAKSERIFSFLLQVLQSERNHSWNNCSRWSRFIRLCLAIVSFTYSGIFWYISSPKNCYYLHLLVSAND